MRYLIRKEQVAALNRVLGKMKNAGPGETIGLTEKEMQAWKDKVPYWDNMDNQEIDKLLADVPEPEKKEEKGKMIRLFRRAVRGHNSNLWTAGQWEKDTPGYRAALHKTVEEYNSDPILAAEWVYSIDEREMQDDEKH